MDTYRILSVFDHSLHIKVKAILFDTLTTGITPSRNTMIADFGLTEHYARKLYQTLKEYPKSSHSNPVKTTGCDNKQPPKTQVLSDPHTVPYKDRTVKPSGNKFPSGGASTPKKVDPYMTLMAELYGAISPDSKIPFPVFGRWRKTYSADFVTAHVGMLVDKGKTLDEPIPYLTKMLCNQWMEKVEKEDQNKAWGPQASNAELKERATRASKKRKAMSNGTI